jgi:tetratricopeptide (TPR) repeat protein
MSTPAEIAALVDQARGHSSRKEFEAAEAIYSRLIELQPEEASHPFNRALTREFRNPDGALADYNRCQALKPGFGYVHYNRGLLHKRARRFREALQDFEVEVGRQASDADVWFMRGSCRLELQDYPGALHDFNETLRLKPDYSSAHFQRARALAGVKDWAAAIADFDRALQVNPNEDWAFYNRGYCRVQLANYEGGLEDLGRFMDKHPEDVGVVADRGNARLYAGQFRRAAEDYERYIALRPDLGASTKSFLDLALSLDRLSTAGPPADFAKACVDRGWIHYREGGYRIASTWFSRAIEAERSLPEGWYGRASALLQLGGYAEAIQDLTAAIERDPKAAVYWSDRGYAKRRSGDHEAAIADYTSSLALDPRMAKAAFGRALSRMARNEFPLAIADLDRSVELEAGDSGAHLQRGWCLVQLRRFEEAVDAYTRAVDLDPNDPEKREFRGYARREKGDRPGAIEDFRKAIALGSARMASLEAEIKALSAAPPPPPPAPALVPGSPDWLRGMMFGAQFNMTHGHHQKAIDCLQELLIRDPKNVPALEMRALCRYSLKDLEGALSDAESVIRYAPEAGASYKLAAMLLSELGRMPPAIEHWTAALSRGVNDPATWGARGECRAAIGDLKGALEDLDRALQIDPGYPPALFSRGRCLAKAGRKAEAQRDLKRALELQPALKADVEPLLRDLGGGLPPPRPNLFGRLFGK